MDHSRSQKINKVPISSDIKGELGAINGMVYVEPDLLKDNVTSFGLMLNAPKKQGVPKTGVIVALGNDIDDLEVGMRVVCNDPNMRGFHLNGRAIVPLKRECIIAVVEP